MKTDDLIDMLARETGPVRKPQIAERMALALGGGFVLGLGLLLASLGLRPDIGVETGAVLMKAAFSGAFAAAGAGLAMRLARPGRPLRGRLIAVIAAFVIAAGLFVIAMIGAHPDLRMQQLFAGGLPPPCLYLIPLFGAPAAGLMMWFARDFAPTRLALAGAAIGAAGGGVGAMAYAMYCPIDSPIFVTGWYGLAIALSAVIGAVVGTRLLRW
jgi:hypothetical protein